MSTAKGPGGRPWDSFLAAHFTKLVQKQDRSRKWYAACHYCGPDSCIFHRDNALLNHLADPNECRNAPAELRVQALKKINSKKGGSGEASAAILGSGSGDAEIVEEAGSSVQDKSAITVKKRKLPNTSLSSYLERPIDKQTSEEYDRKVLRFIVHANVSFNVVEDVFFKALMKALRPMYTSPTRYVLSHTVLDAEAARVDLLEMERIGERHTLTLMVDGWEDAARRSIYGTVLSEVKKYPVVLGLSDLTGKRASSDTVVDVCNENLRKMDVKPEQLGALATDDPSVMKAVRRKWEALYSWVITYACFLHLLNTLIGKITAYPVMKETARKNTRIVSFFNSSHYWGGQLLEIAKENGIHRGLAINTESRWYALILMFLSVQTFQKSLRTLCERPDAQKSKDGLSALPSDIIQLVTRDLRHWDLTDQLLRFCKPLVDAIGNLESRDATLADCMLELLRCAQHMIRVETHVNDDADFMYHAKRTFNREFHAMNTDLHWFTLFLHPLCRKLAVSQAAKSRTFDNAEDIALVFAKKWGWSESVVIKLLCDLRAYSFGEKPFSGGSGNARDWWEKLPVRSQECPLKSMAVILFGFVPHTAEVERLFSSLGGIQGKRRSRLDIKTFEKLGKLRCHYNSLLHEQAIEQGRKTRRTTAHMHTRPDISIDENLVAELDEGFTIRPVLTTYSAGDNLEISGPEDVTMEELDAAFKDVESTSNELRVGNDLTTGLPISGTEFDVNEVNAGEIFDLVELDKVLKGDAPVFEAENHQIHHQMGCNGAIWDKSVLKAKANLT